MREKLAAYLDGLFLDGTAPAPEAREAMLDAGEALYRDKLFEGCSAREAFDAACDAMTALCGDKGVCDVPSDLSPEEAGSLASDEADDARPDFYPSEEHSLTGRILSVLAVLLYFASAVPLLILQNSTGALILFPVAAMATAFLLFSRLGIPRAVFRADEKGNLRRCLPVESRKDVLTRQKRALLFSVGMALVITAVDLPIAGGLLSPRYEIFFILAMFVADIWGALLCLAAAFPGRTRRQRADFLFHDREGDEKERLFSHPIYGVIFGVTLVVYLALSLLTMKWWITWLLWVAAYCLGQMVHALRRDD